MKFLNDEHRNFYYLVVKLIKIRTNFKKITTCEKSFIYLLGLCDVTREHINEIFSLNKGFNIEALEYEWQTETSLKVTKLAFNLLAEWSYDTEQDALQNKVSSSYSVNEIFDCELVPYFIEAIKMRFPQYFKENKIEIQENNDNRFTSWKIEKFEDLTDSNIVGLYVRTCNKGEEAEELVCKQVELLEEYCKDNSIANTILYVDTGASGKTYERDAFKEMVQDIRNDKIQKIIVTEASKLHREQSKIFSFINEKFMKNIKVESVDGSIENMINANDFLKSILKTKAKNNIENVEENI